MTFETRAHLSEWMDEPCTYEDFRGCLRDIAKVNRLTNAYRPTLRWLEGMLRAGAATIHIVDLGCGGGDMLRRIERWARQEHIAVRLTGIDLNPHAARAAREFTPNDSSIEWITADAFSYQPSAPIDLVISSLFAHHLSDHELVRFARWMEEVTTRGWFINDLHRERLPYLGFKALASIMRWHKFVRYDGPVSIRRAFRHDEWNRSLAEAGIPAEEVQLMSFRPAVRIASEIVNAEAMPLVLGGGPAGSMFALTLARAGRDVTLLEKSKEAHHKVCGDFLSRESVLYLERNGLAPATLGAVRVQTVRVVTPRFQHESALPFTAWSLTRRALDEILLGAAVKEGVRVVRDAHVDSLQRDGDMWVTGLRNGRSFRAKHVVLATGKLDVSGWARPQGKQPNLVAFKMYYHVKEDQLRALGPAVELVFYPGGYTGLQPVEEGLVNLTILVDSRRLRTIGSRWSAVLQHVLDQSPHLQARLRGAVEALPRPLAASRIPYGHLQRSTDDGLWRVGDQAAVIPSLCGDGTAIALHSGAFAAACMLRGGDSKAFQRKLYCQLSTRLRLATCLSRLLVARPQASELMRAFPGVLSLIASMTRISDSALQQAS